MGTTPDKNGTNALFQRISEISKSLQEAGKQDEATQTSNATRAYIESQARVLNGDNNQERPDKREIGLESAYGEQISYLHNEFNFDAHPPLLNIALVSRAAFVPIFPPKIMLKKSVQSKDDMFFRTKDTVIPNSPIGSADVDFKITERIERLRALAVHHVPADITEEDFRGGKDNIVSRKYRILDFQQKVITTRRSVKQIEEMAREYFFEKGEEHKKAAENGRSRTEQIRKEINETGISSRGSMSHTCVLLQRDDPEERFSFSWVRHHDHHQTLTAMQEASISREELADLGHGNIRDIIGAPTVTGLLRFLINCEPTDSKSKRDVYTAFDGLPNSWASRIFGRYIQGANYLILPIEALFIPCVQSESMTLALQEEGHETWQKVLADARSLLSLGRSKEPLTVDELKELWAKSRRDDYFNRRVSRLIHWMSRPMINRFFGYMSTSTVEFAMYGAARGAAIVFSDLRNISGGPATSHMSSTLIFDLGMNDYERGRLISLLTEFGTRRFVSLRSLSTFRFLHDILEVVQAELSNKTKRWLGGSFSDRQYVEELQESVNDLTVINDLVDGGISVHGAMVSASRNRVYSQVRMLSEEPLPGFLSLTEFLNRRYGKSVRVISSVAERYDILRTRIDQLFRVVEARIDISQKEDQTKLLNKVDRLTLFGITYYAGSIISYMIASAWYLLRRELPGRLEISAFREAILFPIFLLLVIIAWRIGKDVRDELWKEVLFPDDEK